jgi:hypothetical protein
MVPFLAKFELTVIENYLNILFTIAALHKDKHRLIEERVSLGILL